MSDTVKSGKRFNMVVSVLIAVLLWFYVVNVENPMGDTTLANVPIEIVGVDSLEDRDLILTKTDRSHMSIEATGNRKSFLKLFSEDIVVQFDVSDLSRAGEYVLQGRVSPGIFQTEYNIVMTEKDDFLATVTLQNKETKTVEVKGVFTGNPASGFQTGDITVTPNLVEVSGPEDLMEKVTSAVVIFDDDYLKESIMREMPILLIDEEGKTLSSDLLMPSSEKALATLPVIKAYPIPLTVDIKDGGGATIENAAWSIYPQEVDLSGDEAILEALEEISLGEIDLAQVLENERIVMPIPLPDGVKNYSSIDTVVVDISVIGLDTKLLAVDTVRFENVPSRYNASIASENVEVWVRGSKEAIEMVQADDIELIIDLKDIDPKQKQHECVAVANLTQDMDAGVMALDTPVLVDLQYR